MQIQMTTKVKLTLAKHAIKQMFQQSSKIVWFINKKNAIIKNKLIIIQKNRKKKPTKISYQSQREKLS